MQTRALSCAYAVPLLSALLCVVQSPSKPSPATGTMSATIEDADSGLPLSNTHLQVQLFRQKYEAGDPFCVPSEDAQPLFTFALTTDPNGSFILTAPGGPYLTKVTIPQRQPVFGCIFFDTEESVRACGVDPSSLRIHQHLFIRTAKSIPGFSGDILTNSACAPFQPSPCDPLRVPNLVTTKKVPLLDPAGNPVREARLEFHEYTKGRGKLIASFATDRGV
jgi:hypothetical protein